MFFRKYYQVAVRKMRSRGGRRSENEDVEETNFDQRKFRHPPGEYILNLSKGGFC